MVRSQRTKAIDVKYHVCEDLIDEGFIKSMYIESCQQTVDIFTKSLPRPIFKTDCDRIFNIR